MTAVLAWGRFNPPTKGHGFLFEVIEEVAQDLEGDGFIFATHSQNNDADYRKAAKDPAGLARILRNPLSWETKIAFLEELYKDRDVTIVDDPGLNTTDKALDWLHSKGYTNVVWVAGQDRLPEYNRMVGSYQRTHPPFDSFETLSGGERDPDSELDPSDPSSISGTKLRQAAIDGDYELFASAIDSDDEPLIRGLFDAVRQGMMIGAERHNMEGMTDLSHLDPMTEAEAVQAIHFTNAVLGAAGKPVDSVDWNVKNDIAMLLRKMSQLGPFPVAQKIATMLGVPKDIVFNQLDKEFRRQ